MGESRKRALRVEFDRSVKLEFHGAKITSDAGLLLHRELDEVFGLTEQAVTALDDMRTGKNTLHGLKALLRQSVYGRPAGHEDVADSPNPTDAESLRFDPAMRQVVGGASDEAPRLCLEDPGDADSVLYGLQRSLDVARSQDE